MIFFLAKFSNLLNQADQVLTFIGEKKPTEILSNIFLLFVDNMPFNDREGDCSP